MRRRLLWRVRRKLILSYIFVGLVPSLLIVTFFLLAGLLLFRNMASYLGDLGVKPTPSFASIAASTLASRARAAQAWLQYERFRVVAPHTKHGRSRRAARSDSACRAHPRLQYRGLAVSAPHVAQLTTRTGPRR